MKCIITNKELKQGRSVTLTTGEKISMTTHHAIMMDVCNYFFDLTTAKEIYALIKQHSKLIKETIRVLKYVSSNNVEKFNTELAKVGGYMDIEGVRLYNKHIDALDRKENYVLLKNYINDYKVKNSIVIGSNVFNVGHKELSKTTNLLSKNILIL